MSASFSIRHATFVDCPAIAQLLTELNREEGYSIISDAAQMELVLFAGERAVTLSALVAVLGDADASFDDHDRNIIGVLLYYPGYDTLSASYGYHLADMVVAKNDRRAGVGKALMRALATQTLDERKEWISLTALKRNANARAFYLALGMVEVEVVFFAMGKTALSQV